MRTYGRILDSSGNLIWTQVDSDDSGNFEYGYVTTLIQCLKLSLGESPFYANYGIPSQRAVIQQVFPDFYVMTTQQQFSALFASLQISKVEGTLNPTYNVNVITIQGTKIQQQVAV